MGFPIVRYLRRGSNAWRTFWCGCRQSEQLPFTIQGQLAKGNPTTPAKEFQTSSIHWKASSPHQHQLRISEEKQRFEVEMRKLQGLSLHHVWRKVVMIPGSEAARRWLLASWCLPDDYLCHASCLDSLSHSSCFLSLHFTSKLHCQLIRRWENLLTLLY